MSTSADHPAGRDRAGPGTAGTGRIAGTPRERDAWGRPRNDRPRDGLGRPLSRGAVGVPRLPDALALPPLEALAEAQRLLDTGRPFHAHEVLEGTWKAAPASERALWQGLAQLAVGLTHAARGNPTGAAALLRRGRDRVAGCVPAPHGIDVPGLVAWATALADRLDASGPVGERPLDAGPLDAGPLDAGPVPRLIGPGA